MGWGEPVEFDRRLVAHGYAPGGYMGGKCRTCSVELWGVDKLAWRCKPCAEKLLVDEGLRCTVVDDS